MSREYRHIKQYEVEFKKLNEQGLTVRKWEKDLLLKIHLS